MMINGWDFQAEYVNRWRKCGQSGEAKQEQTGDQTDWSLAGVWKLHPADIIITMGASLQAEWHWTTQKKDGDGA